MNPWRYSIWRPFDVRGVIGLRFAVFGLFYMRFCGFWPFAVCDLRFLAMVKCGFRFLEHCCDLRFLAIFSAVCDIWPYLYAVLLFLTCFHVRYAVSRYNMVCVNFCDHLKTQKHVSWLPIHRSLLVYAETEQRGQYNCLLRCIYWGLGVLDFLICGLRFFVVFICDFRFLALFICGFAVLVTPIKGRAPFYSLWKRNLDFSVFFFPTKTLTSL